MRPVVSTPDSTHDQAEAFVAELGRLQSEVREVERQLDRIEAELHRALNELARERFWEYR